LTGRPEVPLEVALLRRAERLVEQTTSDGAGADWASIAILVGLAGAHEQRGIGRTCVCS
jgi:hypothetical protein